MSLRPGESSDLLVVLEGGDLGQADTRQAMLTIKRSSGQTSRLSLRGFILQPPQLQFSHPSLAWEVAGGLGRSDKPQLKTGTSEVQALQVRNTARESCFLEVELLGGGDLFSVAQREDGSARVHGKHRVHLRAESFTKLFIKCEAATLADGGGESTAVLLVRATPDLSSHPQLSHRGSSSHEDLDHITPKTFSTFLVVRREKSKPQPRTMTTALTVQPRQLSLAGEPTHPYSLTYLVHSLCHRRLCLIGYYHARAAANCPNSQELLHPNLCYPSIGFACALTRQAIGVGKAARPTTWSPS